MRSTPSPRLAAVALLAATLGVPAFAPGVAPVFAEDPLPPGPEPARPPETPDYDDLVRGLSSRLPEVREASARALGALGPKAADAVPQLVRALLPQAAGPRPAGMPPARDPASFAVAEALASIGPVAAPRVIHALRDASPAVREGAAEALGRMRPPPEEAIPHLVRLFEDPERTVRDAASQALARMGPAVVAKVAHAVSVGPPTAREAAARTLALLDAKVLEPVIATLVRALEEPDAIVRTAAAAALSRAPVDHVAAIDALVVALRDRDAHVRAEAAASLEDVGRAEVRTAAALVDALSDAEPTVRLHALASLGTRRPFAIRIVTPVAAVLADRDDVVVVAAAGTLGRMGPDGKNAVIPLLDLLRSSRVPRVRAAAADALRGIGPGATAAAAALRRIATSTTEDPQVRDAAKEALRTVGP